MDVNNELCKYLKAHDFYDFMHLWKKKYEIYGRCGGCISVPLNDSNRKCISLFMGVDYHNNSHAKINYQTLKKAIDNTKFQGANFNEVLFLYFDNEIITRKDAKQFKQESIDEFYNDLIALCKSEHSKAWLKYSNDNNTNIFQRIKAEYFKTKKTTFDTLSDVILLIDNLPIWHQSYDNFALFISRYTKNPHAFDNGTFRYTLLCDALSYFFNDAKYNKLELLNNAGLYKDLTSNYITVFNMVAQSNDIIHKGWLDFYNNNEMINYNIDNLFRIDSISNKYTKRVYVVENPSILQILAHYIKENDIKDIGLVCTYGQITYAGLLILEKLSHSNLEVYYGGDYDPEGLLIAQKVVDKYNNIKLWRYSMNDYIKSISNKSIGDRRIKILDNIINEDLKSIGECIRCYKKAGYQENIIDDYIIDILK